MNGERYSGGGRCHWLSDDNRWRIWTFADFRREIHQLEILWK